MNLGPIAKGRRASAPRRSGRREAEGQDESVVQRPEAIGHRRLEPESRCRPGFTFSTGIDDALGHACLAELVDWCGRRCSFGQQPGPSSRCWDLGDVDAHRAEPPRIELLVHCVREQVGPNEILERAAGESYAEAEDCLLGNTATHELCSNGCAALVIVCEAEDLASVMMDTVDAVLR